MCVCGLFVFLLHFGLNWWKKLVLSYCYFLKNKSQKTIKRCLFCGWFVPLFFGCFYSCVCVSRVCVCVFFFNMALLLSWFSLIFFSRRRAVWHFLLILLVILETSDLKRDQVVPSLLKRLFCWFRTRCFAVDTPWKINGNVLLLCPPGGQYSPLIWFRERVCALFWFEFGKVDLLHLGIICFYGRTRLDQPDFLHCRSVVGDWVKCVCFAHVVMALKNGLLSETFCI